MLRDYELLKQNYADLLKKQTESGLAVSLEKHQEGQQFRVVIPRACLPYRQAQNASKSVSAARQPARRWDWLLLFSSKPDSAHFIRKSNCVNRLRCRWSSLCRCSSRVAKYGEKLGSKEVRVGCGIGVSVAAPGCGVLRLSAELRNRLTSSASNVIRRCL